MIGPSFGRVVQRAVAGDAIAFDELYRSYAGRVRGFAAARGSEDPDAIANDVMLSVFQNIDGFRGDETAFVRWMFTIARNRLIDAHRSRTRRPVLADADVPDNPEPSAEMLAFDNLSLDQVQEWLALLTVEQREVIALRLVEDLSIADVAEIVGRPVTAVKALQRRGLRRLERIILEEGVS